MSSPSTIVGIDPGLSGALAVLKDGHFLAVHDMPLAINPEDKKLPCARRVVAILRDCRPDLVVIEQAGAMPSQPGKDGKRRSMGSQSMFNYGKGAGLVEAAVVILRLNTRYVRPAEWKRRAGLLKASKDAHRACATQRWPEAELKRARDHGRADALLIAQYGHPFW